MHTYPVSDAFKFNGRWLDDVHCTEGDFTSLLTLWFTLLSLTTRNSLLMPEQLTRIYPSAIVYTNTEKITEIT